MPDAAPLAPDTPPPAPPQILLGRGDRPVCLLARMANRHGLVAGATGTGKTVTLRVMAEGFSRLGVPVFMADVKGDLAGMAAPGVENPSRKPVPAWSIRRSSKVAIPFRKGSIVSPSSSAPAGPVERTAVTSPVKLVSVFPSPSATRTATAGEMACPTLVSVGWTCITRVGAPTSVKFTLAVSEMGAVDGPADRRRARPGR